MCLNNPEHQLFQQIILEHQDCQNKIEKAISVQEKKNILDWLWKEVENKHHLKEELLIYPILIQKKKLTEGGPFCSLYFEEHIMNRPSDIVKKITQNDLSWLSHQTFYKDNPTPLNIPLEEHRSTREILQFLIQNKNQLSDDSFLKIFESYVRLLQHHTTKEEKCFFRVCELCLAQTELDEIFSKWFTFTG